MPNDQQPRQLSPHFRESEFWCPCCGRFIYNDRLIMALEELRRQCGNQPIAILSGTRCPEWNEAVGGVPGSQHLAGTAADIVVRGLHPVEVAAKAEFVTQFAHGGVGTYPSRGFVHVDVRNGVARWDG
jgi:uncharacterized protein YcbK (DUF882 family)